MIVEHVKYRYAPAAEDAMRSLVAVAHDAAELEPWHRLLSGMDASLFTGERVLLEELRADDVAR